MNTATLRYHATATGPVTPTQLEAAMAAVDLMLDQIETVTGCTFQSDVTTLAGQVATRTVVFNVNTPDFIVNFPAGTEAGPFYNLYTHVLSGRLNTFITADNPVIA